MRTIAHRANLHGPDIGTENTWGQIMRAIDAGFDVEVDLWFDENNHEYFLGHDGPKERINMAVMSRHFHHLWIHCKNLAALHQLPMESAKAHYFWHENDQYTLTSHGIMWSYMGVPYTCSTVLVMPEQWLTTEYCSSDCLTVCTDYPYLFR